jgi:uncharacterized protein YjeT (DUF2065 family)
MNDRIQELLIAYTDALLAGEEPELPDELGEDAEALLALICQIQDELRPVEPSPVFVRALQHELLHGSAPSLWQRAWWKIAQRPSKAQIAVGGGLTIGAGVTLWVLRQAYGMWQEHRAGSAA